MNEFSDGKLLIFIFSIFIPHPNDLVEELAYQNQGQ